MATADQIQAQIEAARRELQDHQQLFEQTEREVEQAEERQRLRRVLDDVRRSISQVQSRIGVNRLYRRDVDCDNQGPHLYGSSCSLSSSKLGHENTNTPARRREEVSASKGVVTGEYLWTIEGLSWLLDALQQNGENRIEANEHVVIGELSFDFWYYPSGGRDGTLAIVTHFPEEEGEVTFRYKISVKKPGGDFVQWGQTGKVCAAGFQKVGPDVPDDALHPVVQQGIFGLSHEALLKSEYVDDDVLTVKFQLEVRPALPIETSGLRIQEPLVYVPSGTITSDFSSLLETSKGTDVTFSVGGESIKAHSLILSARSDVFDRLLNGGMSESISKEIMVEDCDILAFKATLYFIYTDDLVGVEKMVKGPSAEQGSVEMSADGKGKAYVKRMQGLLAVSHRYQVSRLRLWCEQQLCERISIEDVCSILCQAHLYDAKELENACLSFFQHHRQAVVVSENFGILSKGWPEVMLKMNIFLAGVSEESAVVAIEAHRHGTKRKHDDAILDGVTSPTGVVE